jgi:hypothetical protein
MGMTKSLLNILQQLSFVRMNADSQAYYSCGDACHRHPVERDLSAALRGHRCKERIGSLTHLPSRKSIGMMWRVVPGKPATPFGKNTRRGEPGASRMTLG